MPELTDSRFGYILNELLLQNPDVKEELIRLLPNDLQKDLSTLPNKPLKQLIYPDITQVHAVHYSWLAPFFKTLNPSLQTIYLSFLTPEQVSGINKLLKLEIAPSSLSPWVQAFFRNRLCHSILLEDLSQLNQLDSSAFSPLLKLKKERLLKFIDYLGLHILVDEIHTVVDTKVLRKIYSLLSKNQSRYLQSLLKQGVRKAKSTYELKLNKWDGDPKSLRMLLHKRGLHRLAQSLHNQPRIFQWFLTRKLDVGRGKWLEKAFETPIQELSAKDKMQVSHLINLFTPPKESKEIK